MSSKTRIAVAGAGYIGVTHMGVTQASSTCTLSAVVDSTPGAAQTGVEAGVPLYRSLEELIVDCSVIAGTNGSLSVPTMRLKTYPRPEDRSWWKPFEVGAVAMVRDDPLKHQLEHFGAVIRGEADPLVSAREGLANLRVTEAIVAAARSGTTVELRDN